MKRHWERVLQFDRDRERYARIALTAAQVHDAGECAEQFSLRGLDAIHLASARWLKSMHDGEFVFSAFDQSLMTAAAAAGLTRTHARGPGRRASS